MKKSGWTAADADKLIKLGRAKYIADNEHTHPQKRPEPRPTKASCGIYRSQTEALYARRLDALVASGDILAWAYEAVTLTLCKADSGKASLRYTPDFVVFTADGMELHEVKGIGYDTGFRAKGLVKFRAAVGHMPHLKFRLMVYTDGGWEVRA